MKKKKRPLPLGLHIIRILSILSLVILGLSSLYLRSVSTTLPSLVPTLSTTTFGTLNLIVSLLWHTVIIIAISKRSSKLYPYVAWLLALVLLRYIQPIQSLFTTPNSALYLALNTLPAISVLWYWLKVKPYFVNKKILPSNPQIKKLDITMILLLFIWVIMFYLYASQLLSKSKSQALLNRQNIFEMTKQLENKSPRDREEHCLSLPKTSQDECLYASLSLTNNERDITVDTCNLFSENNNQILCFSRINRCDAIPNQQSRQTCETATNMMNSIKSP